MKKPKIRAKRPYAARYTGSSGFCATPQGAQIAAATYLIKNEQKRCTIEGADGKPLAQVHHNSFWGLTIVPVRQRSAQIIPFHKRRA